MRATAILVMCLFTVAHAQQTYQLVWQDEFNGNSLDLSKWQYEVNCDGGGNAELQCYTNSANNVAVRNGSLVITAISQNYNGKQYTSGRINTARSASWKYGRIDFNAKLPGGIYLWPALWMMPRDSVYGGWAASGEIDIMENRGGQNTQESTLHYGGSWPNNVYSGSGPQTQSFDMTKDFHLYSAIWTPESIQFLIDNKVYHTQSLQRNFWSGRGNNPYTSNGQPFDQNFFIIINLAIGGGFFGANANSLTTDMARSWNGNSLYVDYVRVYQLQNSAVTPNPTPSPSNGACTDMFNSLQCRTSSQTPSQVDSNGVTNSRNWLCSAYPQFCSAINSGGQYSGCNSVEQLSYAMNLYYAQFGGSQGTGACNFGGIGKVISPSVAPTASSTGSTPATTSATSACTSMFNSLQCRTASQDPSQLDTAAISGARNWLCNNYGQYCTAIVGGGQYSTCNSAEQLSYAINQYYNAYSSQGSNACNFGGVGRLVTPGATQETPCQSMYSKLKCRTKSQNPANLDSSSISNTRTWLCNGWPQYCSAISAGGTYSTCNAAEQVSYAMDQYYSQYGSSQGAGACGFGGLGAVSS